MVRDAGRPRGKWSEAADLVGGEFLEGFGVPELPTSKIGCDTRREAWRRLGTPGPESCSRGKPGSGSMQKGSSWPAGHWGSIRSPKAQPGALMKGLAISGDRAGALAEFERLSAGLSQSNGVAPEQETVALAERIRRGRGWNLAPDALEIGECLFAPRAARGAG